MTDNLLSLMTFLPLVGVLGAAFHAPGERQPAQGL